MEALHWGWTWGSGRELFCMSLPFVPSKRLDQGKASGLSGWGWAWGWGAAAQQA